MNSRKPLSGSNTAFTLLWVLALAKFLLTLLAPNPAYELHRDELLYLSEAQHLAWGYLEAPPLLSLLAWISWLPGINEYWVRLWPAFFGALTFLIAGRMVLSLGGKAFALLLLFAGFVFTAFLRLHFLFQPNFLDVFFWTLAAFWVFCYIRRGESREASREENKYLYLLGITAGLGFLSKYSIALFLFALAAALALSPQRRVFTRKHLFGATITGLLIVLPNLFWQYTHNFPIVNHMEELHETQLRHIKPHSFLIEQLLMTLPVFFVWLAGLWYVFFNSRGRKYIVFGWTYLIVIILLVVFQGKAYYALGIYPPLLALGAARLEAISSARSWLRYTSLSFMLLAGIPLIPVLLPIWDPPRMANYYQVTGLGQAGILKWEDLQDHALPQDFADMLGRKELTRKTLAAFEKIPPSQQPHTLIFCDNYGQAGALNYYGQDSGLPRAISASASFLLWIPEYPHIRHIIWVSGNDAGENAPDDEGSFAPDLLFSEVVLLDSITDPMAREYGARIVWFRDARPDATRLLNQEIRKMQQRFRR